MRTSIPFTKSWAVEVVTVAVVPVREMSLTSKETMSLMT